MVNLGLLVTAGSIACGGGTYQSYPEPAPPPRPAPERAGPPPEPPRPASAEEDPPGRVGRISYLQGVVSFRAAEADDWGPAVPNRPVTSGDRLWTDADGRAEVDVGSAMLRMAPQTEADVVRLDDGSVQMRLPQGTLTERVRDLPDGQIDEIDAPSASVSVSQPGEYRVDVSDDGATTRVTVWSGRALVSASGSSFDVNAHQVATVQEGNPPTYDLVDASGPDEFDQWAGGRDQVEDRAVRSRAYVSPDMPGASDLDQYGSWQDDPGVGPVWYPTSVEAGWAPYRTGHWVWVQRWGWTWVDDAPWGYAPYHYGRWAQVGGRWGWCPGRTVAPPVYAPALVVFVGGRPGGGPAPEQQVAWFPLAPGEAYQPAYPTSVGYRQRINVTTVKNVTNITNVTTTTNTTNVTNITNVTNVTYQNRTVANAVTVVPQQTFVSAQPVARAAVPMAPREVALATVVGAAPRVAPTRASLLVAGTVGARAPVTPPPTVAARAVVATHAAPPAPVPFSAQEHALATNAGRPLAPSQVLALHAAPAQRTDVVALRPTAPAAVKVTNGVAGQPAAGPGAQPPPSPTAGVANPQAAQPSGQQPAAVTLPAGAKPVAIEPRPAAPPPPSSPQPGRVLVGDTAGKAKPAVAHPPIGPPPGQSPSGTQVTAPQPPAKAVQPAQPPLRPATPPATTPPATTPPTTTPPTTAPTTAAPRPLLNPAVATPAGAPGTVHSTLDESYAAERAALDARHRDEVVHPKPGETVDAQAKRHDAERRALDSRYQQARAAGAKTLPPPNQDATKRPN